MTAMVNMSPDAAAIDTPMVTEAFAHDSVVGEVVNAVCRPDKQMYSVGHPLFKEGFERKLFYAGQTIFKEGQVGHEAFVVQRGAVQILKRDALGKDVVLAELHDRALFGEMALIDDQPRSATARALNDTVCLVIKESDFKQRMGVASPWIRALMRILVNNVRTSNAMVALLRAADAIPSAPPSPPAAG
ncbi:MAG: Crp/Fnr family transcriptional regulator [Alphaproteobacteria bacterium]